VGFVTRALPEVELAFEGIPGDRHAGLTMKSSVRTPYYEKGTLVRNARQLSLVSEEELALVAAELSLPQVRFTWLGANLVLQGIERLTLLPPSTRLQFDGGATLVVDGENVPCPGPGRVIARETGHAEEPTFPSRFVKAAKQRRGLVAWVERPGRVRVGDSVRALLP
jgi:MOSC domain-containing protein YiiM